jgi:predicted amidophosphoribosyltransferase
MNPLRTYRLPLREAWLDAISVIAPTECSGCGASDRALCDGCRLQLIAAPHVIAAGATTADVSLSDASIEVHTALEYTGVVRNVLLAFKDAGRTDAAAGLARPLRRAIGAALAKTARPVPPAIGLAVIPSTRAAFRTRGYRPVELVLHKARLTPARVLAASRQTEDQAGLGASARAVNRSSSLRARRQVRGRAYLLVDDIVTTGATLIEARRAIEAAGGVVVGAATIAFARRRFPQREVSVDTPQLHGDFHRERRYGR